MTTIVYGYPNTRSMAGSVVAVHLDEGDVEFGHWWRYPCWALRLRDDHPSGYRTLITSDDFGMPGWIRDKCTKMPTKKAALWFIPEGSINPTQSHRGFVR